MFIGICEDNSVFREYENQLVNKWAEKNSYKITVDVYSSAENFLFESEDKIEYDLLILDIQMGNMNGLELAKTLRKRGFSGFLVFLTGVKDFAIEGYEVGAVRYLLKPIKEDEYFKVLDYVYENYQHKEKEYFLLKIGSDVSKIPYENIVYVEARGHYVHLCLIDGEKEWKCSFNTVSDEFEAHDFFNLRRGLLVNLMHVNKITRTDCILDTGESIPVARNKYVDLNQAFIKFITHSK